jgi:nicotinate-nucleotide adenylyltransferase
MQTLAVFGGSFNPPHLAHQMVCLYVLEIEEVDELLMVPTYRHPFAKKLAPFEDRFRMCELSARAFCGRVRVSRIEEELGGNHSRTLDTLIALERRFPGVGLRLVIGSDILGQTSAWYRWDEVARRAPPIVVPRLGHAERTVEDAVSLPDVSSSEVRARAARGESLLPLVPRVVMDYIAERGLYR